jgi:hypothetical protein
VRLVIKRGVKEIVNAVTTSFVETSDHKPVSMRVRRELGSKPIIMDYLFAGDVIKVTITEGTVKRTQEEPLPKGDWFTPAGAQAYLVQRQAAGAKEISIRVIDPSGGLDPSEDVYRLIEKNSVKALGKDVPAWKYAVTSSKMQDIIQTLWIDEHGRVVRSEITLMDSPMVTQASTRLEATKRAVAPEIMVSSFVKPDKAIERARQSTRASYLIRSKSGDLVDLPSGGGQSSSRVDKGSVRVVVGVQGAVAPAADLTNAVYIASSSALNAEDPEVKSLANRALKGAEVKTHREKAELLRAFVATYIRDKNLDTGFASASEVARSKSGDCTEHAVLTAALLRASGIPSRVASGLIYADQFAGARDSFAYHMWTQALVTAGNESHWIDLDATLSERAFDAAHIALVHSPLKDGEMESAMVAMSTMLGQIGVAVEKVSHE